MRKSLRLSLAVLFVGLSLLGVVVVRVSLVPSVLIFGNEAEGVTCGWVLYSGFLMFDRDFSVSVRANSSVSVYILDDVAVERWSVDGSVGAVWAYEDITGGVFSEHAGGRGGFAVLVYLPEDSVTYVKVVLSFSGFEKDLLMSSLSIVGVGIFSLATLLIINLRKQRTLFSGV